MEAVACGRNHHYIHRQPFPAKPSFYAPSNSHHDDATSEDSILHSSLGGFQHAEVESLPADGSDCKASSLIRTPCCSKPSDSPGKGFDRNGKCGANGYHSDGAGEILESFKLVNQTYPHICMDGCCSVAEENDGSLGGKHGNIEGDEEETIGFLGIKSVESVDGTFVAPLRMPESAEVFDFDVSMCYSPNEWSSRASTESPLSVSASPRPPAWPFPVFNRCKTAPVGASSTWNGNELERNLLRSRTDKQKKQKPSESLHQTPSTAEKLSERKRKKLIENLVKIKNDGTVEVDVDRGSEISSTLFELHPADELADNIEEEMKDPIRSMPSYLEIAMLIVGTRGDVQPFVSIGQKLKLDHRVIKIDVADVSSLQPHTTEYDAYDFIREDMMRFSRQTRSTTCRLRGVTDATIVSSRPSRGRGRARGRRGRAARPSLIQWLTPTPSKCESEDSDTSDASQT
ncbi:hypothetical protein L7F22_004337 [Adiantum nelumboides]|nr:hypothetical protein [Adiantum nelumboides]